jgi:omega-6 fatty acid desaturase (delta-12 desaturase)
MRTGADLVRASQAFAREDRSRTWRLLLVTLGAFAVLEGIALGAPFLAVQAVAGSVAGLVLVRLFIFTHDFHHGAILGGSRAGATILNLVGLHTLNPPSVWRETHDYHHRNNAKILGAAIGSYPVLTVGLWRGLDKRQRCKYALSRHWALMLSGYVSIFALGMCAVPFWRDPRKHWQGAAALALHAALLVGAAAVFGPAAAVFAVAWPLAVATAIGAYLFYAQHNFPDIALRERRAWEYSFAALRSSSLFEMSPVMHWFTGNIGYHHVHHLNHRIPFYRLPEAMAAMPELQTPGRTSWRPRDVRACLGLKLWDPECGRMVGWEDAQRISSATTDASSETGGT